jgi:hypothetical protein
MVRTGCGGFDVENATARQLLRSKKMREELTREFDGLENLEVLGQKPATEEGDFVFGLTVTDQDGETHTGTDKKFRHVHKNWVKNGCYTYDQTREKLAVDQQKIQDFKEPLSSWRPVIQNDRFAMERRRTGEVYVPTDHALRQLATVGFSSEGFFTGLRHPKLDPTKKDPATGENVVRFERDDGDAELLKTVVESTVFRPDRVKQDKNRLFRTWNDGTLRAVLSEGYAIINNQWVLETLIKLIPGGLFTHWRGDADTIYGNILIPDTIREEDDSDYGGMLGVGNSEIGIRRYNTLPGLFRSICANGCVWQQEKGKGLSKRHYGAIDLQLLYEATKINLESQIPLLNEGIERILGIKAYGCGDVPVRNIVAEVAKENMIAKKHATGVMKSWFDERYGQTITDRSGSLDNEAWLKFDRIGGDFVNLTPKRWDRLTDRASKLSDEQVAKVFSAAV